ncbi:MAG: DeoR family transcriptional regulator [Patescibacteria group bacterium]
MDIQRQSQLVSFAALRIAAYVKRRELRDRLSRLAFDLIEAVSQKDTHKISEVILSLQGLISLGKALYEVEPTNADIVIEESGKILEFEFGEDTQDKPAIKEVDISGIFKKERTLFSHELEKPKEIKKSGNGNKAEGVKKIMRQEDTAKENKAIVITPEKPHIKQSQEENPAIRQSAMRDKIRQIGEAELKDLIAAFPNVSERTIRYDVQRLCADGLVERIGPGGPGSFYRVRSV